MDVLSQPASSPKGCGVALAFLCPEDHSQQGIQVGIAAKRLLHSCGSRRRPQTARDPVRDLSQHIGVQNFQPFGWPPDDVTALAARIYVRMDLAGATANLVIGLE